MKNRFVYITAFLLILAGCRKDYDIPVPSIGSGSILNDTHPLELSSKSIMEGIYKVTSASGSFGDYMVLKWNRTSLSFACNNGIYFIMDAGFLDSVIYMEGYWRDGYSDGTGLCSMSVSESEGGPLIITGNGTQNIIIRGTFGDGNSVPDQSLKLEYVRPFSDKVKNSKFNILAHRGGGRTSDHLPVSENSIAMLNFTEKLGSTGVELDVRLTTDRVAFLYHDAEINTRLTLKGPLAGPVNEYSWLQLSSLVRLIHGEKIPTLDDALNFVVDSTLLTSVYLDMKESKPAMDVVIPIQQRIIKRAQDKGRKLTVVIGVPSVTVMDDLMTYPEYQNIPSLCELTVEDVRILNSRVWAPRWTLGTQNNLVQQMHEEGRVAVCWTIDNPAWIQDYLNKGLFDGLLTNFPFVVEFYHYIQE